MEVLGDLIKLDSSGHLPLPWSVRAHLGLESGTGVAIALTQPAPDSDRIPDILVTPLTPHWLDYTFSVELVVPERQGAVQDILERVGEEAHVVISDTITLEGRSQHKLNLVIEPTQGSRPESPAAFQERLKEMFTITRMPKPSISKVYSTREPLNLEVPVRIENATIAWNGWIEHIQTHYATTVDQFDLTRVVVSSNPDQRLVRYMIPRDGVVQLNVPHANIPGALQHIAKAIHDQGYNILSSRLSRTSRNNATSLMSVFVAVCEPLNDDRQNAEAGLRAAIQAIPMRFIAKGCTISRGKKAEEARYLVPRGARLIRPPTDLREQIERAKHESRGKADNPKPKTLFFLSYRFVETEDENIKREHRESLELIRDAVRDAGCEVLEAPMGNEADTMRELIYPRLWAADACLVLALDEKGSGWLSQSQCHEIGFFMGQQKRVYILVHRDRFQHVLELGNVDGFVRFKYVDDVRRIRRDAGHWYLYRRVWDIALALSGQSPRAPPNR